MKNVRAVSMSALVVAGLGLAVLGGILPAAPASPATSIPAAITTNVTQHHNHDSRDGLYVDPLFTQAAAAALTRDQNFVGTIVGNVYAQPLYIENGPGGASMVIAVTESNNVYALDASNGSIIWQRNVGTAVTSGLPCGNISPVGITGTPVVDLASRSLFFDAEVTGSGHQIYSLNVDTGAINAGWPVTVSTAVPGFDSDRSQSERAALGLMGGIVYVPYGGRFGDCGSYHGRLVGVQINNPGTVLGWATGTSRAGVWGPGGVANDGTNTYVTTGNGGGSTWAGNEAVIRLQAGPVFSGLTTDFWAPTNWQSLDGSDTDLGGSGPILVDVPGANPSALVVAIGKDHNAYLINRNNLGGISAAVAQASVGSSTIIGAAATYRTNQGTYVVLRPSSGTLTAFKITATSPPTIAAGWSISSSGRTAPFVTSTDGTTNAIVWAAGSDQRLRGYDGDTGVVIFNGGGASDLMSGTRSFNTGIAARGRIYYATDNNVYAFTVPTGSTPTPTPSATATPTSTPFGTPTATPFNTPTATPFSTPTATPFNTPTPTPGGTPTATPGSSPSPTAGVTPTPTSSPTPTPGASQPKALNISTRLRVEQGNNVLIGGFIISGNAPKNVVVRGVGPSLTGSGIGDALADPTLELRGASGSVIAADDDWQEDPSQAEELNAVGLGLQNPKESGIAATLQPGNSYTAVLAGKNQTTGVGLVEIYDINPTDDSQLANISTRGFVQADNNVMIGGFILGGNTTTHVAVRGVGPSLAGLSPLLADPTLELHDSNGNTVVANDNWQDDAVSASELAFLGLGLQDPSESGIYTSLPPGLFTAILAGKNGGTGIGLIEIYNIQ